jgi:hypothetical protein
MKQIAAAVLLAIFATTAPATTNYQDWWWNPALSGMGFNIGQQGNTVVVAWYLYDSASRPTFLLLSGQLVGNTLEGTLWRSSGPLPGPGYDPDAVTSTEVGTGRLVFQSSNLATFTYNYDGLSGTISLARFSYALSDVSGEWEKFTTSVYTNCQDLSLRGPRSDNGSYSINQSGSSITVHDVYSTGVACTYNLTGTQRGSYIDASGTVSCDDGSGGNAWFFGMRVIDGFLIFESDVRLLTGETCRIQSKASGIR